MPVNEAPLTCPKCGQLYPAAAGIHPNCPEGEDEITEPEGEYFKPEQPPTADPA